tara:strand:+ start:3917 stop:7006 length:3090 start_codon:yes stop_codon:yes gene_type:complete
LARGVAMAPAEDAGAPFRRVARADLDALVGGFESRGELQGARDPLTATALIMDPAGENVHVGFATGEVCSLRVVQGTTPAGDVCTRFVVDDLTRVQEALASTSSTTEPEAPDVSSSNFSIRELISVPTLRCVTARADAGVTVHYHGHQSTRKVFCIPNTANSSAIATDTTGKYPTRVAVVCPEGKKKVVVYELPDYSNISEKVNKTKNQPTVVFSIAFERILGSAFPVLTVAWHGGTWVVSTPSSVVRVRLKDGLAEPLIDTSGNNSSRKNNRNIKRRDDLSSLAPVRPSDQGYDAMFGGSGVIVDKAREDIKLIDPSLAPAFDVSGKTNGVLALGPDGALTRVWLDGSRGSDDSDDDKEDEKGSEDEEAHSYTRSISLVTSVEAPINDLVNLTCAPPFAVLASRNGATVVDCVGNAPGDACKVSLGVSKDGRDIDAPLLVAGAPFGAALGRGDDTGNEEGHAFSCAASSSSLVAARGAVVEMHRQRSTRERVVSLLAALRLEEAVQLADQRGGDVGGDFVLQTRAEAGFLAVARLDFSYAVSLWRSVSDEIHLSELLPYFTRQGGSKTAFRGSIRAETISAGVENTPDSFVTRLGARERFAELGGAPTVADLETVIASALPSVLPISELESKCLLPAKRRLVSYINQRVEEMSSGDALKRRGDTLVLVLWAETGNAGALENALDGTELREKKIERDIDVTVLGPVLITSGRYFARAFVFSNLEGDDDAALDVYQAIANGELVEAASEPRGGAGASRDDKDVAITAARLASDLIRRKCRDDLRGDSRPDDKAVAQWTRRHVPWILSVSPTEGVAALGVQRVMCSVDLEFVLAMHTDTGTSHADTVKILANRIAPFAADRSNGKAHTAFIVEAWKAWDENENEKENERVDSSDSFVSPESLTHFLQKEPKRVDAFRALQHIDPNAITSSSIRGRLALGLIDGVRVVSPKLPEKYKTFSKPIAELRGALGDHVAGYRLLTEIAGDDLAAQDYVSRFGSDASAARDKVVEILGRKKSDEAREPLFSLRGKVW